MKVKPFKFNTYILYRLKVYLFYNADGLYLQPDNDHQQVHPHHISVPFIPSPGAGPDGHHRAGPLLTEMPGSGSVPRAVHRHLPQDLAAAGAPPGQHGVWTGGHQESQSAHAGRPQEVRYSHHNDW